MYEYLRLGWNVFRNVNSVLVYYMNVSDSNKNIDDLEKKKKVEMLKGRRISIVVDSLF